jgi:hypothetical protein
VRAYGAPAPPVGLLGADSFLDSEPPVGLDPPLAELSLAPPLAPPVVEDASPVAALGLSPALEGSLPPELASLSLGVVLEPVVEVPVVEVVAVVLVRVASLSAVVLLGGVISGVLRGTASETVPPPQAPRPRPHRTRATALNVAPPRPEKVIRGRCAAPSPAWGACEEASPLALTRPADPSAGRRSDSRSDPSAPTACTRGRHAGSPQPTEAATPMARAAGSCPPPPACRPRSDRCRSRLDSPPTRSPARWRDCADDNADARSSRAL